VPESPPELRLEILKLAHDLAGHGGVHRTMARLRDACVVWSGMRASVDSYVPTCSPCQHENTPHSDMPHGVMQPIGSRYAGHTIIVDYVGPLTVTPDGNQFILSIVDDFTRWVEFYPATVQDSATSVKCITDYLLRHGSSDHSV
jgi:hypothetical protein